MTVVNGTTPKNYLMQVAEDAGVRLKDVLVLAPTNDPFNCGSSGDIEKGQWFAELFNRFGGEGTHLRRIHYRVISQEDPVLKPDGTRYLNTEKDWKFLGVASKHARYLGLVSPDDIVDQRNPDPHLFAADPRNPPEPHWEIEDFYEFTIPSISTYLEPDFDLPGIAVTGYDYEKGDQTYYMEIWTEKSTMNDVLTPLCRQYGANLVTAAGFQSVTNAVQCLSRVPHVANIGRPIRVFYLSDYDPAGLQMPVAVSRQFEFWLDSFGIEADLKLTPIVLTKEQVTQFNLPRVPIKDEDLRKASFEAIHGEGAVELDALEALYPGELAQIVEEHLVNYQDVDLPQRLTVAGEVAQGEADEVWSSFISDLEERADEIKEQAEAVVTQFRPELEGLKERFDEAMAEIQDDTDELEDDLNVALNRAGFVLQLGLQPRPTPEIEPPDESNWLFDASRSYIDQLDFYMRRKRGEL